MSLSNGGGPNQFLTGLYAINGCCRTGGDFFGRRPSLLKLNRNKLYIIKIESKKSMSD
jgi:hypothetical protein